MLLPGSVDESAEAGRHRIDDTSPGEAVGGNGCRRATARLLVLTGGAMTVGKVLPPEGCPATDVDLWADELLLDPYPAFADLRAQGAVVWLNRRGLAALPRFEQVRSAL